MRPKIAREVDIEQEPEDRDNKPGVQPPEVEVVQAEQRQRVQPDKERTVVDEQDSGGGVQLVREHKEQGAGAERAEQAEKGQVIRDNGYADNSVVD